MVSVELDGTFSEFGEAALASITYGEFEAGQVTFAPDEMWPLNNMPLIWLPEYVLFMTLEPIVAGIFIAAEPLLVKLFPETFVRADAERKPSALLNTKLDPEIEGLPEAIYTPAPPELLIVEPEIEGEALVI